MNPNLILPAVALSVIVAAAFIVGRVRLNDFVLQRDGPVLAAIGGMGVVAVIVVLAPPAVGLVGVPLALGLAGLYLLARRDLIHREPRARQSLIVYSAVGALVFGLLGMGIGLVRLLA